MIEHDITGTGDHDRRLLLGALAQAAAQRTSVHFNFAPLDDGNASKRRLNIWWIATVSNLLTGRFADLPLRVTFPTADSIRAQLLRGALFFALAQRPGRVDYTYVDDVTVGNLKSSAGSWSPRGGPVLFAEATGARLADRTYLYANTHVRAEPGYFRRYESSAAFPWLGEIVPRPNEYAADQLREQFLSATCDTLGEVMDNISTHAFNLREPTFAAGWLGPTIVDRSRSCLLVSLTTGGTDSYDRLHFLAIDNGFAIPRTLRWQHPDPLRHDDAGDLMERILQRRLTDRNIPGHNGAGLWFLYGLARFAGGDITVITEDDRTDGQAGARLDIAVPGVHDDQGSRWRTRPVPAPVRGTIVHLKLRVPRLSEFNADAMAETIDDFRRYRAEWPLNA